MSDPSVEDIKKEDPVPKKKTKKPLSQARLDALARGRATRLENLAKKKAAKAQQKSTDKDTKTLKQAKERSEKAKVKYQDKKLENATPKQLETAVKNVEKVKKSLSIHNMSDAELNTLLSDLKTFINQRSGSPQAKPSPKPKSERIDLDPSESDGTFHKPRTPQPELQPKRPPIQLDPRERDGTLGKNPRDPADAKKIIGIIRPQPRGLRKQSRRRGLNRTRGRR